MASGRAQVGDRRRRRPLGVFLGVEAAVAGSFDAKPGRQRVDGGNANAVQAAGDFVATAAEFASGVQASHDRLESGNTGLWVNANWNAPAVVRDGYARIRVDRDRDLIRLAGQRLVD